MAHILAIHGVAPNVDRSRFSFRNMSDMDQLRDFLSTAPRFVALPEALAGRGHALTIDDATRGAADAALLARELGHDVSVFVNPEQVESGTPHSFLVLNVLLDNLDGQPCEFESASFPTATRANRQTLRRKIKTMLAAVATELGRRELVTGLAKRWRVQLPESPPHFQTLRKRDLLDLRDAGVDLQNHGWSHCDHAFLAMEDSAREVREGRTWLRRELGVDAPYFAVPFGEALPRAGAAESCEAWFTVTASRSPGLLAPGVFNRSELDPVLWRGTLRPFGGAVRWSRRSWRRLLELLRA